MFPDAQVAPRLEPAYSKMYFVCIWATFAFSLFWLNRLYGRRVFYSIPQYEKGVLWKLDVARWLKRGSGVKVGGESVQTPSGRASDTDVAASRVATDSPWTIKINWKTCALIAVGFIGGIFSAISGR